MSAQNIAAVSDKEDFCRAVHHRVKRVVIEIDPWIRVLSSEYLLEAWFSRKEPGGKTKWSL